MRPTYSAPAVDDHHRLLLAHPSSHQVHHQGSHRYDAMNFARVFIPVAAMICITALELFALEHNIDAAGLAAALALLAGLGGFVAGRKKK